MLPERAEYLESLKFEHDLINRRLTWLITSQAILFAAYSFALQTGTPGTPTDPRSLQSPRAADLFREVTAITGIVIAVLILLAVIAGVLAKRTVWKDYNRNHDKEQLGVRTWITYLALSPDLLLPVAFIAAWIRILCNN